MKAVCQKEYMFEPRGILSSGAFFLSRCDGQQPNPAQQEPKRSDELKNPKSETNSKFKGSKTANKEKTFEFGTFGFVSNFGIRASNLESGFSIGSFLAILCTT